MVAPNISDFSLYTGTALTDVDWSTNWGVLVNYLNDGTTDLTVNSIETTADATIGGDLIVTGTITGSGAGIVPLGGIIMWSGAIATIPTNWHLCDGTNGTPNLRDRFVVGAHADNNVGDSGGSKSISQANLPYNCPTGGTSVDHTHSGSVGASTIIAYGSPGSIGCYESGGGTPGYNICSHTHSITMGGQSVGHQHDLGGSGTEFLPPYYTLAYIMRIA